jgi:hypothetical protein
MNRSKLNDKQTIMNYILAGRGTITLRNIYTQKHFTFKIGVPEDSGKKSVVDLPHFVKVLSGPDNETDYQFLGTFWYNQYDQSLRWKHGARSRIGRDAVSAKAFPWFLRNLQADTLPAILEVFHEGTCGKCGRKLTVPESIERGLGPTCAGV